MVFRARDRLAGQDVALKSVLRRGTRSSSIRELASIEVGSQSSVRSASSALWSRELARLSLVHEFRTLTSLRHPNIVAVLDYGVDADGMPYITEELIPNAQTLLDAMRTAPLADKVSVLAQLLRALSFLHRRNIIHCDVKPANILVIHDGERREAKLIDFGLAQHLCEPFGSGSHVGTPGYVAPELLAGEPPSASSDLFALGVTAAELFCGHSPFAKDIQDWTQSPDLAPLSDAEGISRLLRRMLAPDPSSRYQTASQVLQDLAGLTGESVPTETHLTRGFLFQQAPLVGREPELSFLVQTMREARCGNGSLVLVSGESGIGKSRLVEELRCQALLDGFLVVHAQAQNEGAFPLQLWREPLRTLCVYSAVDETIERTLKPVLPDLELLLGRPLISTVSNDPFGTPHRIASATSSLLAKTPQPTLLIFEDLHQADSASLELLHILRERLAGLSVLLVGTFRSADRSVVERQFPGVTMIQLRPLEPTEQDRLASSLIGNTAMRAELRELIQRDAGGHPLFLKEVLRELLTQAGSVEDLMNAALPTRVASGGMLAVIRQRLARVPGVYVELLKHCAVAGRRLDLPLLGSMTGSLRVDLPAFLVMGQELGILEHFDREWRFTHDLLHEQIVSGLSEAQRISLHLVIAKATLSVYPDSLPHAATLAFHFEAAREPSAAICHHLRAAEYALQMDAAKVALAHVDSVFLLLPDQDNPSLTKLSALRIRAYAYYLLGRFPDCVRALLPTEQCLSALRHRLREGTVSDSVTGLPIQQSQLNAEEMLMLRAGEAFIWVGQRRELALRTLRAFPRLYREPRMPGLVCFVLGAALAELGALGTAVRVIEFGQVVHRLRGFEIGVFEAYRIRASFQHRQGKWGGVERDLDILLEWGHQRGSLFRTVQAWFIKFNLRLSRNQLLLAEQALDQLQAETSRSGVEEYLFGCNLAASRLALRRGQISRAREIMAATQRRYEGREESALWNCHCALLACVLARTGEVSAFLEAARSAVSAICKRPSGVVWEGDLHILLWVELSAVLQKEPQHAVPIRQLLSTLASGPLSRLKSVPIARPGLLIVDALEAADRGQKTQAAHCLQHAVAVAKTMQMPFEEAWAGLFLSQYPDACSDEERQTYRAYATQVGHESGCAFPLWAGI